MNDRIRDKATREAMQKLHSAIQEHEGWQQEYRAALESVHDTLTAISGLMDVATFASISERHAAIRAELKGAFDVLDDVGVDGDHRSDAA